MPEALADRIQLLLTHTIGCTAHFTQYAGIEALTGPQDKVDKMVAAYRRRRDLLVNGLNAIPGVSCQIPQGAFYAFPNIKELGVSSAELANYILEEAGVAVLPGTAFGEFGEGYLRLAYANSLENLERAMILMATALAKKTR
jgi:aspartate/methionine/tyrosine aminotransferase